MANDSNQPGDDGFDAADLDARLHQMRKQARAQSFTPTSSEPKRIPPVVAVGGFLALIAVAVAGGLYLQLQGARTQTPAAPEGPTEATAAAAVVEPPPEPVADPNAGTAEVPSAEPVVEPVVDEAEPIDENEFLDALPNTD